MITDMILLRNYGAILELDVPGAVVAPSVLLHVSQMDHKPVWTVWCVSGVYEV